MEGVPSTGYGSEEQPGGYPGTIASANTNNIYPNAPNIPSAPSAPSAPIEDTPYTYGTNPSYPPQITQQSQIRQPNAVNPIPNTYQTSTAFAQQQPSQYPQYNPPPTQVLQQPQQYKTTVVTYTQPQIQPVAVIPVTNYGGQPVCINCKQVYIIL